MGAWEGDIMDNAGNDGELLKKNIKRPSGTTSPWPQRLTSTMRTNLPKTLDLHIFSVYSLNFSLVLQNY